jgi:hypothetical protein
MSKPIRAYGSGVQGWKQFLSTKESILRKYDLAHQRASSHMVKVFHGRVAEAAVREWLCEFLPQRYGVTAGYIVSQGVSDKVPLRHFDVIIYDRLESPVLWVDSNPDSSAQGASRAILVEHVRAVLEIKSSFDPSTVAEAMAHLQELAPLLAGIDSTGDRYKRYLPPTFASGIVFVELRGRHKSNAAALGNIVRSPLPRGYFEAVILRGEGLPIESTGTIQLVEAENPLVSNVGKGRDSLFSDKSISNSVENRPGHHVAALLTWGVSQFSMFAFDLLAMLSGTYEPNTMSSLYGTNVSGLAYGSLDAFDDKIKR